MPAIRSKLDAVPESIFSVMTRLANREGAINLSQGFPDFGIDSRLISLMEEAMCKGYNQYAPMPGLPVLREQIVRKTEQLHGRRYDIDNEVTVVPGATLGIYAAITAVVQPGDEVIVFDPAYDSYDPCVRLNGGRPVHIPLQYPSFAVDWQRVADHITERTRLIILNSPHNPTGALLSRTDLDALYDLVKNRDILVLSDEVYEHIVYDGAVHHSLAGHAGLAERSFVISSFGKTYHTTGWKMGYVLAPASLTAVLRAGYQFMAFSAHTPTQYAFARMLEDASTYMNLGTFYQRKRDLFREQIAASRFEILACNGSYFQLLRYDAISDEPDVDFARKLTTVHKVAAIPVSVFYEDKTDHRVLRFCFAKQDETLKAAGDILCMI